MTNSVPPTFNRGQFILRNCPFSLVEVARLGSSVVGRCNCWCPSGSQDVRVFGAGRSTGCWRNVVWASVVCEARVDWMPAGKRSASGYWAFAPQPAEIPVAFTLAICELRTTFLCCATLAELRCSWCSCGTRCCFPCAKLLNFVESVSMNEVGLVILILWVSAASVGRHRRGGEWMMPAHWVAKFGLSRNQAHAVVVGSAASGL